MLHCELMKVQEYCIESNDNTLNHTKHDTPYSVSGIWFFLENNYVIVEFYFRQNLSLLGFFKFKQKNEFYV